MSDIIDRAQVTVDLNFAEAMQEQRRRAEAERLPAIGCCHYCGEPLLDARRFCSTECRDAFDYEAGLRRMQGAA